MYPHCMFIELSTHALGSGDVMMIICLSVAISTTSYLFHCVQPMLLEPSNCLRWFVDVSIADADLQAYTSLLPGRVLIYLYIIPLIYFEYRALLCSCWLSTERGFIWAFVGPVCAIICVRIIYILSYYLH